ncbi:hypothetical protein DICVIV_06166 [Dictyocaulus viviparus]|uniref:Uncharacterized protein n=1 Tax=Dictyocaulus viviparus TaxID=29172 RepID=A0A0D8XVC0_DICVI|nr:hypothetical protein DICVIV_06166 [Dictyocaulus viviparus]
MMSSASLLMTLVCLALSRVNRVMCCIEPDQATSYQRYLDDVNQTTGNQPDATLEWRHIYLAVNNTVSGMFFSLYLILVLVYIF